VINPSDNLPLYDVIQFVTQVSKFPPEETGRTFFQNAGIHPINHMAL
jgi:hypothetical protein